MTEHPELSTLTEADLPALAQLEQECFTDPWSIQTIRATYENPLSLNAAIRQNGRVIAYAMAYNIQGELELLQIAVSPRHRRQGLGKRLLQQIIAMAKSQSAASILLEVRDSNAPARALYESLGFAQTARRKNYYSAPVEDALIMTLVL